LQGLLVLGVSKCARAFSQRSLVGAQEWILVAQSALPWPFWGEWSQFTGKQAVKGEGANG